MTSRSTRATIADVARAAGTAVSTASVALRGESGVSERTRVHVLEVARRLGYRPDQRARHLRQRDPQLIGVTFAAGQVFHVDVLDELYRATDELGYDLVLSATTAERSAERAVDDLLRDRCRTLVLISPELDEQQLVAASEQATVVAIGSEVSAPGVDSVRSDDRQGITDAVDHLVGLGHRSVTYIDGGTSAMSGTRREAYRAAMERHGLGDAVRVVGGRPTEECGVDIAASYVDGTAALPGAVLAHNDMIAIGLVLTLRAGGIAVPGDVSVIGYDNTATAALRTVQLTSVSQDSAALARRAARRAVLRAEEAGEAAPAEEIVTPVQLVQRTSCGAPGASAHE
ncbi:LacI family DNA-binding transcriptional regulator [Salinifilum ghardaiensis]